MKAIVKATNLIVEVEEYSKYLEWKYRDINTGTLYKEGSLDFSAEAVVDYWERLEHQYAGMAMQAMLANPEVLQTVTSAKELLAKDYAEKVAIVADRYATALVKKLKNE